VHACNSQFRLARVRELSHHFTQDRQRLADLPDCEIATLKARLTDYSQIEFVSRDRGRGMARSDDRGIAECLSGCRSLASMKYAGVAPGHSLEVRAHDLDGDGRRLIKPDPFTYNYELQ